MKNTLKIETFKLVHRLEFKLISLLLMLSLVLPIALMLTPNTYRIDYAFGDKIPMSAYVCIGYAFWGTLGIFYLLFSILTVSLTGSEYDGHYFYLYFPRISDRRKIYLAKFITITAFATIWYMAYTLIFNPVGYQILHLVRPDIASGNVFDFSTVYWIRQWLQYYLELILFISISMALASRVKPLAAIAGVMGIYFGSMFFFDIPGLKIIIPQHYKELAMNCKTADSFTVMRQYIFVYLILSLIYIFVLNMYGMKKLQKMEA